MRLKSVLKEPLLHFLLAGAVLFLVFDLGNTRPGVASGTIRFNAGQREQLVAGFARTWQRPPGDAELKGLIDDWVREEIAVREAMASGLDSDDTIIRRRLRQKFEFLAEDFIDAVAPTDAELQAWLDAHPEHFRIEPTIAFRQVFISRERHGAMADANARTVLSGLVAAGADARIDELGDPSMLPQENALTRQSDVAATFGQDFADRIAPLASGSWTGLADHMSARHESSRAVDGRSAPESERLFEDSQLVRRAAT